MLVSNQRYVSSESDPWLVVENVNDKITNSEASQNVKAVEAAIRAKEFNRVHLIHLLW